MIQRNTLSEWLQLMLAEIARKQDESERAHDEEVKRFEEKSSPSTDPRSVAK